MMQKGRHSSLPILKVLPSLKQSLHSLLSSKRTSLPTCFFEILTKDTLNCLQICMGSEAFGNCQEEANVCNMISKKFHHFGCAEAKPFSLVQRLLQLNQGSQHVCPGLSSSLISLQVGLAVIVMKRSAWPK